MIDKQDSTATSKAQAPFGTWPPDVLKSPALDHIVCIMFENRSFDNMLGYLYGTDESPVPPGQNFEGLLTGKNGPYWNPNEIGGVIPAHPYVAFDDPDLDGKGLEKAAVSPFPDPGEEYQHVNAQLYNVYLPKSNTTQHAEEMTSPYNEPPWGAPTMNGFALNYFYNIYNNNGQNLQATEQLYGQIMGSFTPRELPVLSTLAKGFAVYDHWFCSVPTQTFPNRAFFHASTSSGIVTNWGNPDDPKVPNPLKWHTHNPALTIFNRLQKAGKSWAIYMDRSQEIESKPICMTTEINSWAFEQEEMRGFRNNIRFMEDFYDDVEKGNLPEYAFIEPRGFFKHNDMHPPLTVDLLGNKLDIPDPSDVRDGEMLLHQVYTAIKNSKSQGPGQSNAMNTTLLITFDEHGGTYDHVSPPKATPPVFPAGTKMECDCRFDRFGLRVPTIVVSAYTKAGTVINDQMDHSALIATLCTKYGLAPLTDRDRGAPDIGNAFNLNESNARPSETWPKTRPHDVKPGEIQGPFTGDTALIPLTAPALSFSRLLLARYGDPGDKIPQNYGEAYEMLKRLSKKMPQ